MKSTNSVGTQTSFEEEHQGSVILDPSGLASKNSSTGDSLADGVYLDAITIRDLFEEGVFRLEKATVLSSNIDRTSLRKSSTNSDCTSSDSIYPAEPFNDLDTSSEISQSDGIWDHDTSDNSTEDGE